MRSKLIALLIGCSLAAIVGPALACMYGDQTASNQSTSQQTAQSQPSSDAGSN
jgi:hypothetical protein